MVSLSSFSVLGWLLLFLIPWYPLCNGHLLSWQGNKFLRGPSRFVQHSPAQGLSWAVLLLCSAGLPPFFHFFCKLSVLLVMVKQGLVLLALFIFILSAFTCLYYLRAIAFIFFRSSLSYFFQSVYGSLQLLEAVSPIMTLIQGCLLYLVAFLLVNPAFLASWVHCSTLVYFL